MLAGFGIGVFLSYQVESLIRQDVLVEILREFRQKSMPVSMIYPSAKRHLTRTSFLSILQKKRCVLSLIVVLLKITLKHSTRRAQ